MLIEASILKKKKRKEKINEIIFDVMMFFNEQIIAFNSLFI